MSVDIRYVLRALVASLREEARTAEVWSGNNQAILERVANDLVKIIDAEEVP